MTRDAEHTQAGYEDAASVVVNQAPAPSSLAGGEDWTADVEWLRECSRYFLKRDTKGEDSAFWSNMKNSENATRIADRLAALSPEAPVREGVASPDMPGAYEGDGFFGDPGNTTKMTHRWSDGMWHSLEPSSSARAPAAHRGDPCIYCGIGHDDVLPGPCRGDGITISRERAHAVLDYLKNGRGPAGWPTQLWVEVQHFIANIEAALTPRHEAPASTITSAELIANTDYARGAVRVPGETEDQRIYGQPEAPAEGAGEREALAEIMQRNMVPNRDGGFSFHDLKAADEIMSFLRARSSAPEARSPELDAAIKRLEAANRRHRCETGPSPAGDDMRLVLSTIKRLTNGDGQ